MTDEDDLEVDYYGCFRCLVVEGNTANAPDGHVYCAECGEDAIMTLSKALELIRGQYEDGRLYPHDVNGFEPQYDEVDEDPIEGSLEESYEDEYDDE